MIYTLQDLEKHGYMADINWITLKQWADICTFLDLSEEFMDKYSHCLIWEFICNHQKLSLDFIDKYAHKVKWHIIIEKQLLPEEFMEKHKERINFHRVCRFQNISKEFILKWISKLDEECIHLLKCNSFVDNKWIEQTQLATLVKLRA